MWARAEKRRLGLGRTCCEQDLLTGCWIIPVFEDVWEPARYALHAEHFEALESGVGSFIGQLRGMVEVGGREPVGRLVWVPMLAVEEVPIDDRTESAIKQELAP